MFEPNDLGHCTPYTVPASLVQVSPMAIGLYVYLQSLGGSVRSLNTLKIKFGLAQSVVLRRAGELERIGLVEIRKTVGRTEILSRTC